jgi:hypothetical protein
MRIVAIFLLVKSCDDEREDDEETNGVRENKRTTQDVVLFSWDTSKCYL